MEYHHDEQLPLFVDNHILNCENQPVYVDAMHTEIVQQNLPDIAMDSEYVWPSFGAAVRGTHSAQSMHPTSSRSSVSTNFRLSNNSIFSQQNWRDSATSTNTTWSGISYSSRAHHVSHAQHALDANAAAQITRTRSSATKSRPHCAKAISRSNTTSKAPTKPVNPEFSTCVSRPKRSRRTLKEPRYWCTSCKEGFGEKYDWKRHEETYQERCETYQCDLCDKQYFLDKDFLHHHKESHRCKTCNENDHVNQSRRSRRRRTGWGCGFCLRFDADWTERCNHIAWHLEKNGDTIADWNQTQVILSLLQQSGIKQEWHRLLESKRERNPSFGWSQRWAGRAEGYPDSDCAPQLQDLLEFFTTGQNATALVALAYEMGHQLPKPSPPSRGHSPIDKQLPPLPQGPPVPPKDLEPTHPASHPAMMQFPHGSGNGFSQWDHFIETIPEDDMLPNSAVMDLFQPGLDQYLGVEAGLFQTQYHNA
ncbi:hypothetical protein M011DRAFT_426817 [Sporormia fimetaria CBS 119925]|uniref:C2H2-type domain-containing protein n=1 Tax=Sporormia fimetaria CBS 119925 TaxID=1340428 RepID=A0A6A6V5D1_9PLEO|nr:hypothetical protein M011DRAFT_426817 [Sporormia fimetaria CBS 119925]